MPGYYYENDASEAVGPMEYRALTVLRNTGNINDNTRIRQGEGGEWAMYGNFPFSRAEVDLAAALAFEHGTAYVGPKLETTTQALLRKGIRIAAVFASLCLAFLALLASQMPRVLPIPPGESITSQLRKIKESEPVSPGEPKPVVKSEAGSESN